MNAAPALATGAAVPGRERSEIELMRDDGPLARALGRTLGARLPIPAAALAVAGALPVAVAIAASGDDASNGLVAAVLGWFVVLGGSSSGRAHRERLRWVVPAVLRLGEYSSLVWIAVNAGGSSTAAAFALLGALAFRHYDLVYRLRNQGASPPDWVGLLAGGWDGRLIIGWLLLAAGALPAGLFVLAGLLATMLVSESVASWVRFERGDQAQAGSYDDEEVEIQ